MHTLPNARSVRPPAPATTTFDVLVINAKELCHPQTRQAHFQRIAALGQRYAEGNAWMLVMTHTQQEKAVAATFTRAIHNAAPWCRGVRVVVEGTAQQTAQAALQLHRLHFPAVAEGMRLARILVFGSRQEQSLFPTPSRPALTHQHR